MMNRQEILKKIKQARAFFDLKSMRTMGILKETSWARMKLEKLQVQVLQFYYKNFKRRSHSTFRLSKRGLHLGFLLGLVGTCVTFGFLLLFGYRAETASFRVAQDSLHSSSRVLGAHFKYKLEGYREIIRMFVDLQVKSLIKNGETFVASPFAIIPEVVDISLWAARTQESTLEIEPQYVRARLFANSQAPQMSPENYQKIIESEVSEKSIIQNLGHAQEFFRVSPLQLRPGQRLVMMILKIPHPEFQLVAVAHLELSALYSALNESGLAFAAFVDEQGQSLVDSTQNTGSLAVDRKGTLQSMMRAMKSTRKDRDFIEFEGDSGQKFIGSFERLGVGQAAVVSLIPLERVTSGFEVTTAKSIALLIFAFLLFLSFGYSLVARMVGLPPELTREEELKLMPQKSTVTVLHGSLRQLFYILEIESPEQARDTLNEFFTLASQLIESSGGLFERVSGRSFIGVWGVPEAMSHASERAVRIALELRKAYFKLDEARRIDGQKPFSYTLAVHEGEVLAAQMGPSNDLSYSVAGDVIQQAAALEGVALSQKKDLLISDTIWRQVKESVSAKALGEVKLSAVSGLVSFYEVLGEQNGSGQFIEVPVHPSAIQDSSSVGAVLETVSPEMMIQEQKDLRWVVNNGNQIIGPFSAGEIAKLLFTQELDFDCECWEESSGRSSQIQSSGMFSGVSEESEAHLWMYDGEMMHGPVTSGFIQTAIQHAAISSSVWICDSSTVQGWRSVHEFLDLQKNSAESRVKEESLHSSSTEHLGQDGVPDSLKRAA